MDEAFRAESPNLRAILERAKEADPRLATGIRRALRDAGDVVIAEQRAILAGAKPGSIRVTGSRQRLVVSKKTGRAHVVKRNVYERGPEKTGGVSQLRDEISKGLVTRITAGQTVQAVRIKSTGPRDDGYNMARVWEKAQFRHPVFGHGWTWQQGQPYFFTPIRHHLPEVRETIRAVLEETIERIAL